MTSTIGIHLYTIRSKNNKAAMWCVGNHNIPHACQDTNASIESYHTNIKDFGMFKKKIDLMQNGLAYLSPYGRCVF
jgi:hypothetical protein